MDTHRTSIDFPRDRHQRLREAATRRGCSARQLILGSIERPVLEGVAQGPARRLSLEPAPISSRGRGFGLSADQTHELTEFP